MTQIVETTGPQLNESYGDLTKKIRNSLIVLIHLALSYLILEIYPSGEPESDLEIVISLSLLVSILFTYYLIGIIPDFSEKFTYSLQLLILINVILANSVIDLDYYGFVSIIGYLGISILFPYLIKADDPIKIHQSSMVMIHIATLIIWVEYDRFGLINKPDYDNGYLTITQLVVGIALIVVVLVSQNRWLFALPIFLQSILAPFVIYTDFSWLLFGLFAMMFLGSALWKKDRSFSRFAILISTILLTLMSLTFTDWINWTERMESLSNLNFHNTVVIQALIAYAVFIALSITIEIRHKYDDLEGYIPAGAIVYISLLFVYLAKEHLLWYTFDEELRDYELIDDGYLLFSQIIIGLGLLSIGLLRYFNNNRSDPWIHVFQAIGILLLSTLPFDQNDDKINLIIISITFSIFVASSLFVWYKHSELPYIIETTVCVIGGLILLYNFVNVVYKPSVFSPTNYVVLLIGTLVLGIMAFKENRMEVILLIMITQAITLISFAYETKDDSINSLRDLGSIAWITIDPLEIALLIYLVQILVIANRYRDTTKIAFNSQIILSGLTIVYIIFEKIDLLDPAWRPGPIYLGILILGASTLLYLMKERDELKYGTQIQGLAIVIYTLIDSEIDIKLDYFDLDETIRLTSILFLLFSISMISFWLRDQDHRDMLENFLIIIPLLIGIFTFESYRSPTEPGIMSISVVILLLSIPLFKSVDINIRRYTLLAQATSIVFLSLYKHDQASAITPLIFLFFGVSVISIWFRNQEHLDILEIFSIILPIFVAIFTLESLIEIDNEDIIAYTEPGIICIGSIIFLCSLMLYKIDDINIRRFIAISQSISIGILTYYSDHMIDFDRFGISFEFSRSIDIVFLVFSITVILAWLINRDYSDLLENLSIIIPILIALFTLESQEKLTDSFTEPGILSISVVVLILTIPLLLSTDPKNRQFVMISQAISIVLLSLFEPRLIIGERYDSIVIIPIIFLIFGISVISIWLRNQEHLDLLENLSIIIPILLAIFTLESRLKDYPSFTELGIISFGVIILTLCVPLAIAINIRTRMYIIISQSVSIGLLSFYAEHRIDLYRGDLDFVFNRSIDVIFLVFSINVLITWFRNQENIDLLENLSVITPILIGIFTLGSNDNEYMQPGIIWLSLIVILLTVPLFILDSIKTKKYIMISQAISIVLLSLYDELGYYIVRMTYDDVQILSFVEKTFNFHFISVVFLILTLSMIFAWLRNQASLDLLENLSLITLILTLIFTLESITGEITGPGFVSIGVTVILLSIPLIILKQSLKIKSSILISQALSIGILALYEENFDLYSYKSIPYYLVFYSLFCVVVLGQWMREKSNQMETSK
ncbi:MAG: hypothetical protein ACXAD7_22525, partial [Candidatus Kariarchaeaceae archaeon]